MSVPQQVNTLYRIECVIRQFDPPLTGDGLLSLAENLIDSLVGKEIILPESRRISGTCYYMYICVHTNTTHTHTRTHTRTHTHTCTHTHAHTHTPQCHQIIFYKLSISYWILWPWEDQFHTVWWLCLGGVSWWTSCSTTLCIQTRIHCQPYLFTRGRIMGCCGLLRL